MKKQFCKYGHNISIVGRNKSGACTVCGRERWRLPEYRVKQRARDLLPTKQFLIYKSSAKSKGLCFDLTVDQFIAIVLRKCIYRGKYCNRTGVDRIDSSKGYTLENCQPMCTKHNIMKNKFDSSEFLGLASTVK